MLKIVIASKDRQGILHKDLSAIVTDPKKLKEQNKEIHHELAQLCKEKDGVGVSAPQVGMEENFFFVTAGAKFPNRGGKKPVSHMCFNPTWEPAHGTKKTTAPEGCLSLPGRHFNVERYHEIEAEWTNAVGHPQKKRLRGWAARVFQHECDHLKGIILTDHPAETEDTSPAIAGLDQTQALKEGWCVIDANGEFLEIQADDEFDGCREEDGSWFEGFPTDGMARAYVMERADERSAYHLAVLRHITHENQRRYRERDYFTNSQTPIYRSWIFMWLRTWNGESVTEKSVCKVRPSFNPNEGPDQHAVEFAVGSNQDIVPLEESDAVPEVTCGNSALKFGEIELHRDEHGKPAYAKCRECGEEFPTDLTQGENMKVCLMNGSRRSILRCPHCTALGHKPPTLR